jgi:hypothetical protein
MSTLLPIDPPSLISEVTFNLEESNENSRLLSALRTEEGTMAGKVRLKTNEFIHFKRTGKEFGSIFAEYESRLVVHIKYRVYHYSFLPAGPIMQTVLWKDSELPITNFFSPSLFFDVMMRESNAVVTDPLTVFSDKKHSSHGREFWKRRTHDALLAGFNVALVDFDKNSYRSVTSHSELEEMLSGSWGQQSVDEETIKMMPWLIWKNRISF